MFQKREKNEINQFSIFYNFMQISIWDIFVWVIQKRSFFLSLSLYLYLSLSLTLSLSLSLALALALSLSHTHTLSLSLLFDVIARFVAALVLGLSFSFIRFMPILASPDWTSNFELIFRNLPIFRYQTIQWRHFKNTLRSYRQKHLTQHDVSWRRAKQVANLIWCNGKRSKLVILTINS